jgi:hypothetical protein
MLSRVAVGFAALPGTNIQVCDGQSKCSTNWISGKPEYNSMECRFGILKGTLAGDQTVVVDVWVVSSRHWVTWAGSSHSQ